MSKGKKHLCQLSAAEINAIIDCEQTELLSHKEIACRHKIPTALVGRIIRAARKDSNYF